MSVVANVIDYGPDKSSHYPTLMKLKATDKEINMLVRSYENAQETSIMNIRNRNWKAAKENMDEMKQTNDMLLAAAAQGRELLEKAIPEGGIDQKIVAYEKPRLDSILNLATERIKEIKEMKAEMVNINGDLMTTELDQNSNWLQYIILVVVGFIVVGLTAKTIIDKKTSNLDNAILAIVIGVIVYYLIKKYM